jgi:hypothetical protein
MLATPASGQPSLPPRSSSRRASSGTGPAARRGRATTSNSPAVRAGSAVYWTGVGAAAGRPPARDAVSSRRPSGSRSASARAARGPSSEIRAILGASGRPTPGIPGPSRASWAGTRSTTRRSRASSRRSAGLWSTGWGGYVLFDWDTFFAASLARLSGDRDLAYADALEILRESTAEGIVPELRPRRRLEELRPLRIAGGRDHGPRPIYRKFHDAWLLRDAFGPLLRWNRWWDAHRGSSTATWSSAPTRATGR